MEYHEDLQNLDHHLSRTLDLLMAVDGLMSFTSTISQKVTQEADPTNNKNTVSTKPFLVCGIYADTVHINLHTGL